MSDDVEEIVSLLDDQYARDILEAARDEPLSAEALMEACEASSSTIYRRIEWLQDSELLDDEQRLDPKGHHYKVYTTRMQGLTVELRDDGFSCEVDRGDDEAEDAPDRFTRLYEGFK